MVTYEYFLIQINSYDDIEVPHDRRDLLSEFRSAYFTRHPKGVLEFATWLGQRGWRIAHIVSHVEGQPRHQRQIVVWWMERASIHYCESCAKTLAVMDGLRQVTSA